MIESYEKEFNKDFSDFAYDETMATVSSVAARSYNTISWQLSQLRKYNDWCIQNGKTKKYDNALEIISVKDIDNSKSIFQVETLKSPEHLHDVLDVAFPKVNEINDFTVPSVFRLYMWLLYNGLTDNEAAHLKKTDVDEENQTITVNNRTINMYPKTKLLVNYMLNTKEFATRRFGVTTYMDVYVRLFA